MAEYPEPEGYVNRPGYVKSNPLNNESYLEQCCEAYPMWADILRETHSLLDKIAPGYNIAQIKDKFGGLRYYWDCPIDWREDGVGAILDKHTARFEAASMIVANAEWRSYDAL